MRYPEPLVEAVWVRRYKRFLLDVRLKHGGEMATAHCPNTGSMRGIQRVGARCLLLSSRDPKRRLRYTLEAVRVGRDWVGAHPLRANTVGREAIEAGLVRGVARSSISAIRTEVPYGSSSRADLVIDTKRGEPWFVEIKSASLAEEGVSLFPDAVTERGKKHLDELARVVRNGGRALMLFVATRDDVDVMQPAWGIDPAYSQRLAEVTREGVAVRAVTSRVTKTRMAAKRAIRVDLTRSQDG